MGCYCLMSREFQLQNDEKVLEMDTDNDYTTTSMYLMLLTCILKMVKIVNLGLPWWRSG